ncbi:MAG TPA: hypothetical protein VIN06_04650 [Devosia sp.]
MYIRPITLAVLAGLVFSSTVQALELGGRNYPDRDERTIIEACRGLDAQSRMSLTSDVPDDIESADPSSEYRLSQLPFTLADCRGAGIV